MAEPAKNLESTLEPAKADDDPVLRALEDAPFDDEPLTPEQIAAIEEAERDVAEHGTVAHASVKHNWPGRP